MKIKNDLLDFILNNLDFSKTFINKNDYIKYANKLFEKNYNLKLIEILLLIPILNEIEISCKSNTNFYLSFYVYLNKTQNFFIITTDKMFRYLVFIKNTKNYEDYKDIDNLKFLFKSYKLIDNAYFKKETLKIHIELNKNIRT